MPFPDVSSHRRRDVLVLAVCQGLFTSAIAVDLTLTGLVGLKLAPDKILATLPFALITVAGAVTTLFASFLMQRLGRRQGFALGALCCFAGGLVSVWSVSHHEFWLFCLGTALVGTFQAFAQYYRLAAADAVANDGKAKAISTVLAGGVIAAVLGPALAAGSRNLLSADFAGSYAVVSLLGLASFLMLLLFYGDKAPLRATESKTATDARPLTDVLSRPITIAAIANMAIGGAVMMLLMTAAPLAAVAGHHTIAEGAMIIQWHLVGMYAPSLFVGRAITRVGTGPVLFTGIILMVASAMIGMESTELAAFFAALLCLGIGWNFMFVGGTTLLAQSYRPSERAAVQGAAEGLRYTITACAALSAGPLLAHFGWTTLNAISLPTTALAALATIAWLHSTRKTLRSVGQS